MSYIYYLPFYVYYLLVELNHEGSVINGPTPYSSNTIIFTISPVIHIISPFMDGLLRDPIVSIPKQNSVLPHQLVIGKCTIFTSFILIFIQDKTDKSFFGHHHSFHESC